MVYRNVCGLLLRKCLINCFQVSLMLTEEFGKNGRKGDVDIAIATSPLMFANKHDMRLVPL